MRRRRVALAGLLILLLSGCPRAEAEPVSPRATATSSATPTTAPAEGVGAPSPSDELDQHQYPELEALLPDEIAGVPTDQYSFSGAALGDGGMIDDLFIAWATKADRSSDQLRVAVAVPALEAELEVFVAVMELPGLSGEELAAGGLADIDADLYAVREIAGREVAIGPAFAVFSEGDRLFMAVDFSGLGDSRTDQPEPSTHLLEQAIAAIP